MSMNAKQLSPLPPQGFVRRMLRDRSVRTLLLVGVLLFELGFIWFIQHFGWMESVNIWTQVAVVLVVFSPLIIGLLVLARKRFKLSSLLVAFSLIAVFMGLSMRPVYEARQERVPTKVLLDAGVQIGTSSYEFEFNEGLPKYSEREAGEQQCSDWILRMLGEYSDVEPAKRVRGVSIQNSNQLEAFAEVGNQFPDLKEIRFDTNLNSANLKSHAEFLNSLGVKKAVFYNFSNYGSISGRVDLRWLNDNRSLNWLSIYDYPDSIEVLSELPDFEVEHLGLQLHPARQTEIDWISVCRRPLMQQLKFFTLTGYKMTNEEAQQLGQLKELLYLNFHHSTVSDFGFLNDMPKLVTVSVQADQMSDEALLRFPVSNQWKRLWIYVPKSSLSEDAIDRMKQRLPEGCEFSVIER